MCLHITMAELRVRTRDAKHAGPVAPIEEPRQAGDYTITMSGARDSVTRQTTYRLTVDGGSTTLSMADPGVQTSVRGRPVSLQMNASGGSGGNRFTATGLPAGLSINQSTGLISGIPPVATNYRPAVRVTDSSGDTASVIFYWFIFPY